MISALFLIIIISWVLCVCAIYSLTWFYRALRNRQYVCYHLEVVITIKVYVVLYLLRPINSSNCVHYSKEFGKTVIVLTKFDCIFYVCICVCKCVYACICMVVVSGGVSYLMSEGGVPIPTL